MDSLLTLSSDLAWPFALIIAWFMGELGARWARLPRISIYGLVGFILSHSQTGFLPPMEYGSMLLLANIAFGLILFECGYRINLRWLKANPWIGISGLVESIATFAIVYVIASWYGTPIRNALLLGSLAMATSPAGILRVINEQRSSGQVTERILHLCTINSVLAVFTFKVIVGFFVFQTSGSLWQASSSSLTILLLSVGLGLLFGLLLPTIMRRVGNLAQDGTIAFALAIILLVAINHTLKLSPVLSTITFGLVARHHRVALSQARRNFGALGELLTVMLFVFVVSTLEWKSVINGFALGFLLIAVRLITKTLSVSLFSRLSGISWRKGILTGIALSPISVFVILVLEQAKYLGIDFADEMTVLATMTLFMELIGPIITQHALIWAKETQNAASAF